MMKKTVITMICLAGLMLQAGGTLAGQGRAQVDNRGIGRDGSHRFIHISDTEIPPAEEGRAGWLNTLQAYAWSEKAAFIILTSGKGCRMLNTRGGNSLSGGDSGGVLPDFYSFEAGNTHYVVLPPSGADGQPSPGREDIVNRLKTDLRRVPLGKPVILFCPDMFDVEELQSHNLKARIYGGRLSNHIKKPEKAYTLSTNAPDKGGADHSTAAFRVIDVDSKGNISSQLRYAGMDKHIEIATPGEDGFPLFTSGAVPLTVNVYHSASPTKEVTYTCTVDRKKFSSGKKLARQTDWTWKDIIYLNRQSAGKQVNIKVTATFNNGETAEKEVRFTYGNRKPITNLTENWNNLLANAEHTAQAPLPRPLSTREGGIDTLDLKMAWVNNVGSNVFMTSPIVYRGNVFIASVDENMQGKACIYGLSGQTGDILWRYYVDNSIKNTIVADDDNIYAQTAQGTLYAIKASDGSLAWGRQLHVDELPALTEGLAVANGVLYAGTGAGMYAMDTKTGDKIWQNKGWQQAIGATSTLTLGQGMLIGSAQGKGLYGNDARTGELKWHLDRNGLSSRGASAAIYDNLLYVTSSKSLFIIDPVKGNVIARKDYPFSLDVTSTPLVTDGEILFGSASEGLIAVDKETLEVKWKYQTGDALLYTSPNTRKPSATIETSPVLGGSTVFFGASDGVLYGLNKATGELVWHHRTGAPSFSSLAISGNTLIAADFGGNVYAFTDL